VLPRKRWVSGIKASAGRRAELLSTSVGVEWNVRAAAGALSSKRAPIDRRVEDVGAIVGRPFQPRMSLTACAKAFSDDESNAVRTPGTHRVIERHGFAFTISIRTRLNFLRGFPFHRKSIWNRPQIADPVVHERQRKILILVLGAQSKHWANTAHLPIIGRRINRDIGGLAEDGQARETKEGQRDKTGFAKRIGADAYCYHNNYNSHEHALCHGSLSKTAIGKPPECGRLGLPTPNLVKTNPARYKTTSRVVAWALFASVVTTVIWARLHLAGLPLERDEGEYAYMGQLLLAGVPPYKLAYSMKLPGTSAAYAAMMAIFGQSTTGLHVGLILVNLVTIGLIFLLGKQLLNEIAGIAAAGAYATLSLMPYVLGQAAHATHFVVLLALAGAVVLVRHLNRQSITGIFFAGFLLGLAFVMKQPGFLFVIFGSVCLFGNDWRRLGVRPAISRQLVFFCGALSPFSATCLLLWAAGVIGKFWFWTVAYAGHYGGRVSMIEGFQIFIVQFPLVVQRAWPLWVIAAIGLGLCTINKASRPNAGFLITFLFFSLLAVCPGLYFRPHYFILLIPAISLLVGAAVMTGVKMLEARAPGLGFVPLLVFAAALTWPIWKESDFFFQGSVREANRMVNGTNPFPESIKIGEFIRSQSDPADRIAVLGSEPEIYFYAHRASATGYIYTYALMEPQPYAHQMQLEMIREIETARPRFLILVVINKSWLAGPDSDQTIFKWADTYSDADYEEIGLINIFDRGTDYYFSARPADVKPAPDHILIYRRKA
jgi:hypothetical protein